MKQVIKLSEKDLHKMVRESVKRIMCESVMENDEAPVMDQKQQEINSAWDAIDKAYEPLFDKDGVYRTQISTDDRYGPAAYYAIGDGNFEDSVYADKGYLDRLKPGDYRIWDDGSKWSDGSNGLEARAQEYLDRTGANTPPAVSEAVRRAVRNTIKKNLR